MVMARIGPAVANDTPVLDQILDGDVPAIKVSKTYPFLIPIFRKCIPDPIPIVKIAKFDTVPYTKIAKIDTINPDGTSPYPKYV